ncbi:MAG TPA: MFS transporter [Pirellulales bacterium]|nr:MFS transporter [Pirellulales bacterium]
MAIFWRKPAPNVAERSRRRITLHLVPLLFFLYILAYIDRSNISVANLGMQAPPEHGGLGLSNELIGVASGLFFWGYWILEIPSTLSVERWGVRWVFVRILILWGITASIMGAIGTPAMSAAFGWLPHISENLGFLSGLARFYNGLAHEPGDQLKLFRFLLGFFEGGFFPSVIVYLSYWFRSEDRAKAIAGFALAMPLSMAVGNWISSLLIEVHWFGVIGWRWVFIVEGALPVLAGIATFFLLPNRPSEARWLNEEERNWLAGELDRERKQKQLARAQAGWQRHLLIVLLLTTVYFCQNITIYGVGFFMPKIMGTWLPSLPYTVRLWLGVAGKMPADLLLTRQEHAKALLAVLPYLVCVVALLLNARHSDRTRERTWHAAIPLAILSIGMFLVSQLDGHPWLAILAMIFVVGSCIFTHIPAFWPMPTMFLGAAAAASAIGFINMIGNLGGFVGPVIAGYSEQQHNMAPAIRNLSPWALIGAAILVSMDLFRRAKMRRKAP